MLKRKLSWRHIPATSAALRITKQFGSTSMNVTFHSSARMSRLHIKRYRQLVLSKSILPHRARSPITFAVPLRSRPPLVMSKVLMGDSNLLCEDDHVILPNSVSPVLTLEDEHRLVSIPEIDRHEDVDLVVDIVDVDDLLAFNEKWLLAQRGR